MGDVTYCSFLHQTLLSHGVKLLGRELSLASSFSYVVLETLFSPINEVAVGEGKPDCKPKLNSMCSGTAQVLYGVWTLPSIPGHAAEGGHRRPRMCSSWTGGTGPSSLDASARNSLLKK